MFHQANAGRPRRGRNVKGCIKELTYQLASLDGDMLTRSRQDVYHEWQFSLNPSPEANVGEEDATHEVLHWEHELS